MSGNKFCPLLPRPWSMYEMILTAIAANAKTISCYHWSIFTTFWQQGQQPGAMEWNDTNQNTIMISKWRLLRIVKRSEWTGIATLNSGDRSLLACLLLLLLSLLPFKKWKKRQKFNDNNFHKRFLTFQIVEPAVKILCWT